MPLLPLNCLFIKSSLHLTCFLPNPATTPNATHVVIFPLDLIVESLLLVLFQFFITAVNFILFAAVVAEIISMMHQRVILSHVQRYISDQLQPHLSLKTFLASTLRVVFTSFTIDTP